MEKLLKVLIVDDDRDVCSTIEAFLQNHLENLKITKAYDGLEAYHYSMTMQYDLIICDHKMPFCTGLDFITKVRTTNNTNQLSPVIFISGFIPDIESKLSKLDGLLYLNKPFVQERLLKFCKFLLNKKIKNNEVNV
jgi:DNA-binding response OmpR family regulator